MTDLPLIKAAKLWAKVSARTGATYLTGRWGGCRVLVFENLERQSEAEPSHFLFLGEAGEWPVPDQANAPVTAPEPVVRSTFVGTPVWKSTWEVSLKHPLVGAVPKEKFFVVVPLSVTRTLVTVLEL